MRKVFTIFIIILFFSTTVTSVSGLNEKIYTNNNKENAQQSKNILPTNLLPKIGRIKLIINSGILEEYINYEWLSYGLFHFLVYKLELTVVPGISLEIKPITSDSFIIINEGESIKADYIYGIIKIVPLIKEKKLEFVGYGFNIEIIVP